MACRHGYKASAYIKSSSDFVLWTEPQVTRSMSGMANTMLTTARPSLRSAIAGNVRALMGRYQVKQTDLAHAMGITQPSLSAKLNAETAWRDQDLEKIAEFFNVPPGDLMKPCFPDTGASTCIDEQLDLGFPSEALVRVPAGLPVTRGSVAVRAA